MKGGVHAEVGVGRRLKRRCGVFEMTAFGRVPKTKAAEHGNEEIKIRSHRFTQES